MRSAPVCSWAPADAGPEGEETRVDAGAEPEGEQPEPASSVPEEADTAEAAAEAEPEQPANPDERERRDDA